MEQALEYRLQTLTVAEVARKALVLLPWLDKFLSRGTGEMTAREAIHEALLEKLVLVLVRKGEQIVAIIAFEVVVYPSLKALRVVGMAGSELGGWRQQVTDYLTLCAKALGASRLEACGRKGLGRLCGAQERARFFVREV